tara:strand:- start:7219 stop:7998 length:780 start_codon:yes stop_codon:yes gene_type:complete
MNDSNIKHDLSSNGKKVALITGAARRIGRTIAEYLHSKNYNIIIHYKTSEKEAIELKNSLNKINHNSSEVMQFDFNNTNNQNIKELVIKALSFWGKVDLLVNNASSFYETKIGDITVDAWDELINSNLKAPVFLSQELSASLIKTKGSIVNICDIHAKRPIKNYIVYSIAKSGLYMATKSLARELGPDIRVNAVAPGSIIWPEEISLIQEDVKQVIIDRTALKKPGEPLDIAEAVYYLANAKYVTGQMLAVDGGRTLQD